MKSSSNLSNPKKQAHRLIEWLVPEAVWYADRVFDEEESTRILARLIECVPWEQYSILLFGRRIPSPRLSAWYGSPGACYSYSSIDLDPLPWTAELKKIRIRVEEFTGNGFNSVLLNRYRDGSDSMGWHADDEPELGPYPFIASVSFGAPRRFLLKRKRPDAFLMEPRPTETLPTGPGARVIEKVLESGSMLVMQGRAQTDWKHAIPKTRKIVGERINLTFRTVIPRIE